VRAAATFRTADFDTMARTTPGSAWRLLQFTVKTGYAVRFTAAPNSTYSVAMAALGSEAIPSEISVGDKAGDFATNWWCRGIGEYNGASGVFFTTVQPPPKGYCSIKAGSVFVNMRILACGGSPADCYHQVFMVPANLRKL
jgi:hypothetical protein